MLIITFISKGTKLVACKVFELLLTCKGICYFYLRKYALTILIDIKSTKHTIAKWLMVIL